MGMTTPTVLAFFGAAGLTLMLTPLVRWAANTFGLVDTPNVRKVHRIPVPRIGGIGFGIATLVVLIVAVALGCRSGFIVHDNLVPLLAGAGSVLIVGVFDDLFDLRSTYKLFALMAASVVFCGTGGAIHKIVIDGHLILDLGIAAWPVTILWIVTISVSINFIDGLDGLAAGIGACAAVVLAAGAAVGGSLPVALIGITLCGALMAFMVFNYNPATIFMGDGGSLFIGFLLAGAAALANHSIGSTRALLLPALALSVPLLDTALTMVRRGVLQRRSLFAAERGHVHHRLMDSGLGHLHTVMLLHGVTVAATFVGMICIFAGGWTAGAVAVMFGCGLVMLFRSAGSVRARETVAAIRRNRAIGRENRRYLTAYYDLQLRFREARTVDGWWEQLCRAADVLDFAKVDVPMLRRDGSLSNLKWRRTSGDAIADARSITAEIPIPQRRTDAALRAQVEVTINQFLESGGHRVALFSRLMGEFGLDHLRCPLPNRAPVPQPTVAEEAFEADTDPVPSPIDPALTGPFTELRIAIVHDFLYTYAGAERVLEQLVEVFPHADLFALFDFLGPNDRGFIQNKPVQTSFLQHMPLAKSKHRAYLPLMPMAIEQLDVSKYDLVISSSYMAAKGVLTRPHQLHVCYCHTPVRFAWDLQNQYLTQTGLTRGLRSIFIRSVLHYIRSWDLRSAQGVDVFLTNSNYVGRRIQKLYRRKSITIYPPVDTERFTLQEDKEDFYLTASRMVPYKRIDLIVETFARMPTRRLLVVGEGPEMARIKAKASPNITFLGHESTDHLRRHMQLAKAFVFAAEEDFGIAPVEAMGCGTPVIAFGRGGVTETVIDGITGVLFTAQTPAAIIAAIERFEAITWDAKRIRQHAQQFSVTHFRSRLSDVIAHKWESFTTLGRTDEVETPKTAKANEPHHQELSL